MAKGFHKRKGVRIKKDQSALEAIRGSMPHWIHHTRPDENSVTGFVYLPQCDCSECGYTANMEKPTCPRCGAKMNEF